MSESNNNSKGVAQTDAVSILTFTSDNDSFARLELLSSHTLWNLVDTLCEHTPVGFKGRNGVNDHIWKIHHQSKIYISNLWRSNDLDAKEMKLGDMNLSIESTMQLEYHREYHKITMVDCKHFEGGEEAQSFYPRNNPESIIPSGFERYVPSSSDVNLDLLFPSLQRWIFDTHEDCMMHLFQPGRKQNFGFLEKTDSRVTRRMLYLPVKPSNLMNWIGYFDEGSKKEPKQLPRCYLWYTGHSVVIMPRLHYSDKLYRKYVEKNEEPGICDVPIVNDMSVDQLTELFPKIAALAGCVKDKKVKKGWINLYKRKGKCNLSICCGKAINWRRPMDRFGDATDGALEHKPVDEPLFSISDIKINGLHDLFCIVEGLLMTL